MAMLMRMRRSQKDLSTSCQIIEGEGGKMGFRLPCMKWCDSQTSPTHTLLLDDVAAMVTFELCIAVVDHRTELMVYFFAIGEERQADQGDEFKLKSFHDCSAVALRILGRKYVIESARSFSLLRGLV